MSSAPPVLTPERIDAMLSRMAEVCMEAVDEAGARLKAAADEEAFERAGRTLQGSCRNLRQTIALKQRFDREQARLAVEARREAEDRRREATHVREAVLAPRRWRVRAHFQRLLWDEYEDDDAREILGDIEERFAELAQEDGFAETPVDALIARLAEEFEIGAPRDEPPDAPAPPPPQAAGSPPPAEVPPEPDPPPGPDPPPEAAAPPAPAPEPYIPPWERIPPGRFVPGGSSDW